VRVREVLLGERRRRRRWRRRGGRVVRHHHVPAADRVRSRDGVVETARVHRGDKERQRAYRYTLSLATRGWLRRQGN
jgi:hypothetical protein